MLENVSAQTAAQTAGSASATAVAESGDDTATEAAAGAPKPRRSIPGTLWRGTRKALLSPCTWITLGAMTVYWIFAYGQYMQQQVGACDLGIFYQATAGWAQHFYPYVPIKGFAQLGDHFTPILILLAPALWIHNSPATMVFAQVVLLCLSGVPVYVAIRRVWGTLAASLMLVAYLFSIGMQGSIAFPVHEVMFSAPLIAWGIERAMAGRWTWACLVIGSTVFVKEDMGTLIVCFAVWLAMNRKWRHAAIMTVWGIGMFVLTVKVIIPYFNPSGFTYADDYMQTLHATSFGGEISAIFLHPANTLHLMFGGQAKKALWLHVLMPVAFLCLCSPITLMALPSLVTSTLSGRETQWTWNLYYEMPLMPIVFLGAVDGVNRLIRLVRWLRDWNEMHRGLGWLDRRFVPPLAGLLVALFALHNTWHVSKTEPLWAWTHDPHAYTAPAGQITDVTKALAVIPSGVEVRATNNLLVPLAARDTVTLVGSNVDTGDWAAIDTVNPSCPVAPSYIPGYMSVLESEGFRIVDQQGNIVIMHRTS